MEEKQRDTRLLQWHPGFYAGLQIELSEDADRLIFENEHQLGTKPKEIDILVIKRNPEEKIHKNIGRLFRTYNIVEYKSPKDYLSIDDYYKTMGYACFYKADAPKTDSIKISDITVSFVFRNWPRRLAAHLIDERHLYLKKKERGLYYINGELFPVQMICTSELSPEKNIWLSSLTNDLKQGKTVERLLQEYHRHHQNGLYRSAMNLIIRANRELFQEGKIMCEALRELFKDELEVGIAAGIEERLPKVVEERMPRLVEERVAEVVEERVAEAKREGIFALIADNLEEGFSFSRILEKLEKRFGLTAGEAEGFLKQYTAG